MKKIVASCLLGLAVLAAVGCSSTTNRESTGEYIDDSAITTKVKTALFSEKEISSGHISVETYKGVVQLSGFVSSQAQVDKAGVVASKVSGVKKVHNSLIVKPEN